MDPSQGVLHPLSSVINKMFITGLGYDVSTVRCWGLVLDNFTERHCYNYCSANDITLRNMDKSKWNSRIDSNCIIATTTRHSTTKTMCWFHTTQTQFIDTARYNAFNITCCCTCMFKYRQVSNIRRTKCQHLKYSRTVLRLSLPNTLKPDVESRIKM